VSTKLLFVRHGQTAWNAHGRWQGHTDVGLDSVGHSQALALSRRLHGGSYSAIYCSDLLRAAKTAEILAEALGMAPVYDVRWRERDVGLFAGLTGTELRARYPAEWAAMQNGTLNPPGGEPQDVFHSRVISAFEEMISRHAGETVLVVSHGGTIGVIVGHVLGMPPVVRKNFSLRGNTGLTIVEVDERGPVLTLLNDTCHLNHNGQG